jgi:hypothetical protein
MKIIHSIDVLTSDSKETIEIPEAVGKPAPFCYHINSGNYGYGKFKIDSKSLAAFSKNLHKVEKSMSRN